MYCKAIVPNLNVLNFCAVCYCTYNFSVIFVIWDASSCWHFFADLCQIKKKLNYSTSQVVKHTILIVAHKLTKRLFSDNLYNALNPKISEIRDFVNLITFGRDIENS